MGVGVGCGWVGGLGWGGDAEMPMKFESDAIIIKSQCVERSYGRSYYYLFPVSRQWHL